MKERERERERERGREDGREKSIYPLWSDLLLERPRELVDDRLAIEKASRPTLALSLSLSHSLSFAQAHARK